jgi:two-component system sensor histidine kinase/response regulator
VEKIKAGQFDLVLMDVNMPEMDGLEATRLIRSLPAPMNNFPVVAFTASVTKAEVQKCIAAGMNAVVPKPFKESELMEALYSVIRPLASDRYTPPVPDDSRSPDEYMPKSGLGFLESLTGGNQARIHKYLGLYLASVQSALPNIEAALAANDRDNLRRVVHTLKPQFKMVGLPQTAAIAAVIEDRLLTGAEPAALFLEIERLLEEIRHSIGVFNEYLRKHS